MEQLQRIADALEVPLAELLGLEPVPQVQAVGADTDLRFQKRKAALDAAFKTVGALTPKNNDTWAEDMCTMAQKYENYFDREYPLHP